MATSRRLRAKAGLMSDDDTRALYFRIADVYEAMARNEDRVKRVQD